MILIIENLVDKSEKKFPMNTSADVHRFLEVYPHLDHLRAITHDIKDFAAEACQELSRHHLDAYTEESEHFKDPHGDPWSEHKYNRGGEASFVRWLKEYHAKDNEK